MTERTRFAVLAALGLALIAVLALGAGMQQLEFEEGKPFVGASQSTPLPELVQGSTTTSGNRQALPLIQGVAALIFLGLVVYISVSLIRTVRAKHILISAAALTAVLALVIILSRAGPSGSPGPVYESSGLATPQVYEYAVTPLGNPPRSLTWLVILSGCVLAAGLGVWFLVRRSESGSPLERVLEEAEQVVGALQSGQDVRSVIVRCYLQMSRALQQERGIERAPAVTPREFTALLVAKGIPAEPVRSLTALFEAVRYGDVPVSAGDEQRALESLQAIIAACRQGAQS